MTKRYNKYGKRIKYATNIARQAAYRKRNLQQKILDISVAETLIALRAVIEEKEIKLSEDIPNIFNNIYKEKVWGSEGYGSGRGSDENLPGTKVIEKFLLEFLEEKITSSCYSVLDVGCGGGWLYRILKQTKNKIKYVGDDVCDVVLKEFEDREKNMKTNIDRKLILSTQGLPPLTEGKFFDVIIMKEVLQHLLTDDAVNMIKYILNNFDFKHFIIINKSKLLHRSNRHENLETTRTLDTSISYRMAPIDFNRHLEFNSLGFKVIDVSKIPAWQLAYYERQ